jgi:branched-chain amino acid transport system permease protein
MTSVGARPSRQSTVRMAGLAALVVIGATFPLWNGSYSVRIATGVALWAGLALSWNVICGYAGYISFGHVAFFGIGGYTTGILMQPQHGWPFLATLPVAALVAAGFAAVAGWPALRLKGAYFAIATWAIAEAVRELATVSGFTGGSGGLTLPVSSSSTFFYYAMLVTTALAYVLCYVLLERSRFGFRVRAVRDNEAAARAQGIDATRVKMEAFMLSAAIPAVLGGINAYWITFINPDSVLNTIITDQMVVMVLVGGLGHVWGPALGATVLYLVNEQFLTSFGSSTSYIAMIGIIVMLVVLFLPDGVVSLLGRGRRTGLVRQLLGRAADDVRPGRPSDEAAGSAGRSRSR